MGQYAVIYRIKYGEDGILLNFSFNNRFVFTTKAFVLHHENARAQIEFW